jgi:heme exporter protein C
MKSSPTMVTTMLVGMLIMALAFWAYTIAMTLVRVRCIVLERERHTEWVKTYMESKS